MLNESIHPNKEFSVEKTREEIKGKVDVAIGNPIAEERAGVLQGELQRIRENFISSGKRSDEDNKLGREIEEEIKRSMAEVETLPEFRILLEDVYSRYKDKLQPNFVDDYLEHENAHANTKGRLGYKNNRYGILFIKNSSHSLSSIQPMHISEPDESWSPKKELNNDSQVLVAPDEYGHEMSDGDKEDLEVNKHLADKHGLLIEN